MKILQTYDYYFAISVGAGAGADRRRTTLRSTEDVRREQRTDTAVSVRTRLFSGQAGA